MADKIGKGLPPCLLAGRALASLRNGGRERMKSFEYFAPRTIQEAIGILHYQGPEGKVLAGGTDLMVAMKERGVRPRYVVGLSQVRELRGIDDLGEGGLSIRAATTAYDIEFIPVVR